MCIHFDSQHQVASKKEETSMQGKGVQAQKSERFTGHRNVHGTHKSICPSESDSEGAYSVFTSALQS